MDQKLKLKNMAKILLISGSPRKGNTDFILDKIYKALTGDQKIIYLKDKDIKHCRGCLICLETGKCVIRDDMDEIKQDLLAAEILIIGSPNYYNNVPGLLKDFIDRTLPFSETDKLKGKKAFFIVVGGEPVADSKKYVADQALKYLADILQMEIINSFIFQALRSDELSKNKAALVKIDKIINEIKSYL
jgi:multimeric flavodoxin WrbA